MRSLPERAASFAATVVITVLVGAFFLTHQAEGTGFFRPGFTVPLAVAFYAALFFGIVSNAAETLWAGRSVSLAVQLAGALLWTGTSVALLLAFPFDFAHLPDVAPAPLRPLLAWISQDIGWVLWALFTVGSAVLVAILTYRLVAATERERGARPPAPGAVA